MPPLTQFATCIVLPTQNASPPPITQLKARPLEAAFHDSMRDRSCRVSVKILPRSGKALPGRWAKTFPFSSSWRAAVQHLKTRLRRCIRPRNDFKCRRNVTCPEVFYTLCAPRISNPEVLTYRNMRRSRHRNTLRPHYSCDEYQYI